MQSQPSVKPENNAATSSRTTGIWLVEGAVVPVDKNSMQLKSVEHVLINPTFPQAILTLPDTEVLIDAAPGLDLKLLVRDLHGFCERGIRWGIVLSMSKVCEAMRTEAGSAPARRMRH